jgi:surfeit locus 1 family protein
MAEARDQRFPFGMTIAALVALAILLGLGTWQVKRLHWKEGVLARIAALQTAPPRSLTGVLSGSLESPDLDFTRVSADCPDIETTPSLRLYAVRDGGVGSRVITACTLKTGPYGSILVDRGFMRQDQSLQTTSAARLTNPIVGVLRRGDKPNFVTPPNEPGKGVWYWRDIAAMAKALGAARPAPTYLMLEAPAPAGGVPTPAPIPQDIPNNHLQYAITWYGLAVTLVGVYLAVLFRRRQG